MISLQLRKINEKKQTKKIQVIEKKNEMSVPVKLENGLCRLNSRKKKTKIQ